VGDARAAGRTVIMASHDLDRAVAVASRQVTIEAGTARRGPSIPADGQAPTATAEVSGVG